MTTRTPFCETEALLIAMEDGECDRLREYLAENFLPNELDSLGHACRARLRAARETREDIEGQKESA